MRSNCLKKLQLIVTVKINSTWNIQFWLLSASYAPVIYVKMTTVKSYAVLNNINEVSRGDNFQGQIFSKFLLSLNKPETAFCLQCCVKDYHSYVGADGRLFCSFVKRNRVELLHQPSFLKDDNQPLVHWTY